LVSFQSFKITMRVASVAVLSLLFLASFAHAVSNDADDSLQVHGGEHLSDEDVDLISEEVDDDSDLTEEEDEHDSSDLSEEESVQLKEKITFHWYGRYCGPGYCAGKKVGESKCKFDVQPIDSTDRCCFNHDKCCGTASTRSKACNQQMVACLGRATCKDGNCNDKKNVMAAYFLVQKDKVCGSLW
jgi:hypothetical protein